MTVTDETHAHWDILARTTLLDVPPYLRIERQTVRLPGGRIVDDFHHIALPDHAIAVPVLDDGRVLTLWQYKHGCGRLGLTFPAGHIEPGEAAEVAMRRELREETGYTASVAHALGVYAMHGNQGCGHAHLFALTDCRQTMEPDHDDLEVWEIRLMTKAEVDEAIAAGAAATLSHLAVWLATKAAGLV